MTYNGTEKAEIVLKVSPQLAAKISDVAYSLGVVEQLMQRIMEQHRNLANFQQNQMDSMLMMLCNEAGQQLPHHYEYKLDMENLVLSIRDAE